MMPYVPPPEAEMSTSFDLPGMPLESEKFLPPAATRHKKHRDEKVLLEQNADRERIVCGIGIDVHYEMGDSGDYFNPRMNGPACPYPYTGKIVAEETHAEHRDDPVALGRKVAATTPYDVAMYAHADPRKRSKTVVVRDYGCKIPIDLADTEKIAKAVLNDYTDAYVSFLGEFVSTLFGASMRAFLDRQIAGYQKLLDHPEEVNRVAWGSYMSVQGGSDKEGDTTLPWNGKIETQLQQLTRDGQGMTSQVSSKDVYDLSKCLRQHIDTLKTARDEWCRGFGSDEENVLAMLFMANEYGRNMCADLQLMADSPDYEPDYDAIHLHVPHSFYSRYDVETPDVPNPDANSSVRAELREAQKTVGAVPTYLYPVGNWSGTAEASNVFLGTAQNAPYMWGWGHPANLAIRVGGGGGANATAIAFAKELQEAEDSLTQLNGDPFATEDEVQKARLRVMAAKDRIDNSPPTPPTPPTTTDFLAAPYHKYGDDAQIRDFEKSTAFVDVHRWGREKLGGTASDRQKAFPAAGPRGKISLRDSLLGNKYRAVVGDDDKKVISGEKGPEYGIDESTRRAFLTNTPSYACDDASGMRFSVVDPELFTACDYIDPFLRHGGACFDISEGTVRFPARIISTYTFKDLEQSSIFKKALSAGDSMSGMTPFTIGIPNKELHEVKKAFKDVYPDGAWPYHLLTVRTQLNTITEELTAWPFPRTSDDMDAYVNRLSEKTYNVSHNINVSSAKFTTDMVSLDMSEVACSPEVKYALQIYLLRKVVQYSMGPDVACVIFAEPFPEVPEKDTTAKKVFNYYNALWKQHNLEGTWNLDDSGSETKLKVVDRFGKEIPAMRLYQIMLRGMLNEFLRRIKAFLDKDEIAICGIVSSAVTFIARQNPEADNAGHLPEDKKYLEEIPVEWHFQVNQNTKKMDPRMLFAGTYKDWKRYTAKSAFVKAADMYTWFNTGSTKPLPILDAVGLPEMMDEDSKDDMLKYVKFVRSTFDAACKKRPGVAMFFNAFLRLKESQYKGTAAVAGREVATTYRAVTVSKGDASDTVNVGSEEIKYPVDTDVKTIGSGPKEAEAKNSTSAGGKNRFVLLPLGDETLKKFKDKHPYFKYNTDIQRPQLFAMLDAAALLWNARAFYNPADANRPSKALAEHGSPDAMHYFPRYLVEAFQSARELYKRKYDGNASSLWEIDVKADPESTLPTKLIGALCDDSFGKLFPLLPANHSLRDKLRRVRALHVMWGTLPSYKAGDMSKQGAWMPVSPAHRVRLLGAVNLYDQTYRVPDNPWLAHASHGSISLKNVFHQSYHSVYKCEHWRTDPPEVFREWLKHACRYQPARPDGEQCYYPFSQYGGTLVEGDFLPHRVERPHAHTDARRHAQIVYNRFGFTAPLRIGQQFKDRGLLQDLFSFEYRPYADLSKDQRAVERASAVYPSNFMAYARTHAIVALASHNHGSEQPSEHKIVRNLYRLYVDTYACSGASADDDGVPVVMGFHQKKGSDGRVTLYAGTLGCLNAKIEAYCNSPKNRGGSVCASYKQVYLNDATLLYTRLLRAERRRVLHDSNFLRAQLKRGRDYSRADFNADVIDLQDEYINFLQLTVLGMLIESNADLHNVPLHLLEPRELEVSASAEDGNVTPHDYLSPQTQDLVRSMDWGGDNLDRRQLAILSLIPPNNRILGTLRLHQKTDIVDLGHVREQIQRAVPKHNEGVWRRYAQKLVEGSIAARFLEESGAGVDHGFDESAILDPLKEAAKVGGTKFTTTNRQHMSSLAQSLHADAMARERGPMTIRDMSKEDIDRAVDVYVRKVRAEAGKRGVSAKTIANNLRCPEMIKKMVVAQLR